MQQNPYASPAYLKPNGSGPSTPLNKILLAKCCLALSSLFWIAVSVVLFASCVGNSDIDTALEQIMPYATVACASLGVVLSISLLAFQRRKKWSIPFAITFLVFSGFSVMLPVSCVGVYAFEVWGQPQS